MVIDHGEIKEMGTHEALLQQELVVIMNIS